MQGIRSGVLATFIGLLALLPAGTALAVDLLARPAPGSAVIGSAERGTLQLVGKLRNDHGNWSYMTDGTVSGWVNEDAPARLNTAPPALPPAPASLPAQAGLRARPKPAAPIVHALAPGVRPTIVDTQVNATGTWAFVQAGNLAGWMPASEAQARQGLPPAANPPVAAAPPAPAPSARSAPSTVMPAAAPPPPPPVAGPDRMLYAQPDANSRLIGPVPGNAQLDLLDVIADATGEWWKVNANGRDGWMRVGPLPPAEPAVANAPAAAPVAVPAKRPVQADAPMVEMTSTPPPAAEPPKPAVPPVALRARPLADSPVIAKVADRASLSVQNRANNAGGQWLYLTSPRGSGWIHADEAPEGLK